MILNTQPREPAVYQADGTLKVFSVFDTIQGEGVYTGYPATFLRLAGCNLECFLCDTIYTGDVLGDYNPGQLVDYIKNNFPKRDLIVLTGGEPFRQDFRYAVNLLMLHWRVQIETNGTLFLDLKELRALSDGIHFNKLTVVCSPKTPSIHNRMWEQIDSLKYVVEAGKIDDDGLPLSSVGPQYGRPARPPENWYGSIYVEPLDCQDAEKNDANMKAAVQCCLQHNYRLSLQTHKIAGLP